MPSLNLRKLLGGSDQGASPLGAAGWSTVSFVIAQALGSLLYLPLARILNADQFGMYAAVVIVYGAVTLLAQDALMLALIRLPGSQHAQGLSRDDLAAATTWLSAAVGLTGAVLCALSAWPVAYFYDDGRLRLLMLALSPAVLFAALGATPFALLARELDFRRRTVPETAALGIGGLVALVAGLLGAGVYSLAAWTLTRTAVGAATAWWVLPDKPPLRLRPERRAVRRILGFGLPASGGNLALYARLSVDNVVVGRQLGSGALGVYTLAWSAAVGPALLLDAVFGGVGYATFARLQGVIERLRDVFLSSVRLIAAIALPLFCSAVFLREEIVVTLYGERWRPMIAPLLAMFLLQGLREVCRPGASVVLALGHNRVYAAVGVVCLPLTIVCGLVGTEWGVTGVAWGMFIAVGLSSLAWPLAAGWYLRPSMAQVIRAAGLPLLLTAVTVPAVIGSRWLLEAAGMPVWLRLLLAILCGFGVWAGTVALALRSIRHDLNELRRRLPGEVQEPLEPPLPVSDALVEPRAVAGT